MADNNSTGQAWLHTRENSILLQKTQEVSIFPHPNALYALYRAIIHQEPLNQMVGYPFIPFQISRPRDDLFGEYGERKEPQNYGDWISILVGFLNSPLIVEYNSDTVQTVQLTHFGHYIFPHLMKAFADLYRQNDTLRKAVAAYHPPTSKGK